MYSPCYGKRLHRRVFQKLRTAYVFGFTITLLIGLAWATPQASNQKQASGTRESGPVAFIRFDDMSVPLDTGYVEQCGASQLAASHLREILVLGVMNIANYMAVLDNASKWRRRTNKGDHIWE
jgi:hypothetical protein